MEPKLVTQIAANSPIAAVLLLLGLLSLRLLKHHLKQMKALVEENLQARKDTREKLDLNSERLGENSAIMEHATRAIEELNRHLSRNPVRGQR